MPLTVAELTAVYSVDEGPLDKSLGGLGGKVSGALKGAALAATGLIAFSGISAGFLDATGAASDLNETINKSGVIFGNNAGMIDQWAKGAAVNLGLSRQQALAAAAGFGDMFGQIGFAGDEAAGMSQQVVQMSADLGSFNNLDTADVADRMSAAFRGEYDSLQALIPNINAARVEQEAMAATGKKNAQELTAQEKAAAVLAIVNADGARAMGDFAKTSDGAANAAKIATAEWNDQKAAIGQELLPAMSAMIGFVRSSLIPGVGALVTFITGDVIPAIQSFGQFLSDNQTPILLIAGLIAGVFLPHLVALGVTSLITGAKVVVAWLTTQAGAIAAAAVHSAQIAMMILRWAALAGAAALNAGLTIGAWIGMGIAAGVQAAVVVAAWVGAQIRTVASLAVMAAGFVVQGAVMVASAAVTAAGVVAGWVVMGTQSLIQAGRMAAAWFIALGPIGWVIAAVIGLVALIIANWDSVKRYTSAAWEWVSSAVSRSWSAVTGAVSSGVSSVISWVSGLPGRVTSALGNIGSLLVDAGSDLLMGMVRGITNVAGRVASAAKDAARAAVNGVKSFLGIASPSKVFTEIGTNVGLGFLNGIAGMQPAVAAEMLRLADHSALQSLLPAGTNMVRLGDVPESTWDTLRSQGWKGRAGDRQEALYRPEGQSGPLVAIENYHPPQKASAHDVANDLATMARTGRAG